MDFVQALKNDLKEAIKSKDEQKKEILRSVIGEFERQGKKEFTDDDVYKVLKSMVKLEKERMDVVKESESALLSFLESYMPSQVSDEEVEAWIKSNIDFSQYNNKMQAMGVIIKHFGKSVDGGKVREILGRI